MTKKKIEQVSIAELDSRNIYIGIKTINETDLKDNDIKIPAECDLLPGKYYFDHEKKTFLPTEDFLVEQLQSRRNTPKSVLRKKAR